MANHEPIFPVQLALRALRAGSYRNTAYALAEIIDNSYEAKAKNINVALICKEGTNTPTIIAVLDDGIGMDKQLLRKSVQYGYGTHLKARPNDLKLGRFGVGLVASSLSQCPHLEVVSWQKKIDGKSYATEIRITDDEDSDNILPTPIEKALPEWSSYAFKGFPHPITSIPSGTLIVWREVTPTWKKASTLQEHLAFVCGHIYRNFIRSKDLQIVINVLNGDQVTSTKSVSAIDPMFLHHWEDEALKNYGFTPNKTLFQPYSPIPNDDGKHEDGTYREEITAVYDDQNNEIGKYRIMASHRRMKDVVDAAKKNNYPDPGNAPFGQLARKLQGVSILRGGREIMLDPNWLRTDQTLDRWVSVSLDFDPALDGVLGVSNNKQDAQRLAELAKKSPKELDDGLREAEDWAIKECYRAAKKIKSKLSEMARIVKKERVGERKPTSPIPNSDPSVAPSAELADTSRKIAEAVGAGSRASLPVDNTRPDSDPKGTTEVYVDTVSGGEPAQEVRPQVVMKEDLKVDFVTDPHTPGSPMFDHISGPGHLLIRIREQHPVYHSLSDLIAGDSERVESDAEERLHQAIAVIRKLLYSYARAEEEAPTDSEREKFEMCRTQWGSVAKIVCADHND